MTMKAAMPFLAACLFLFLAVPFAGAEEAGPPSSDGRATREVLSVSWQAGYCAVRPKSRGCAGFSAGSPEAIRFSLHGLSQVRRSYCGIAADVREQIRKGKWTDLPEVVLAGGTRERLDAAMPAAQAGLDRQQWLRNGGCVAETPEAYYSRSLDMLDALNHSAVRALFAGKAGGAVTLEEVRAVFDGAFGAGTGERVRLACRKAGDRQVVTGLTIGLGAGPGDLAARIGQAAPTRSRCTGGLTGSGQGG